MFLKRKFSIIITMFICLLALLGLASCDDNNTEHKNPNNPTETTPPKSAIESLNTNEKQIYDKIIVEMFNYKDPTSVMVLSIPYEYWNAAVEINLQGKNDYGSNVTNKYLYFFKSVTIKGKDIAKYSSGWGETSEVLIATVPAGKLLSLYVAEQEKEIYGENGVVYSLFNWQNKPGESLSLEISTGKINAALNEYKTLQGWS